MPLLSIYVDCQYQLKEMFCVVSRAGPGHPGTIGQLVVDPGGFASIDLSACSNSILIVKVGDIVEKVVLLRP